MYVCVGVLEGRVCVCESVYLRNTFPCHLLEHRERNHSYLQRIPASSDSYHPRTQGVNQHTKNRNFNNRVYHFAYMSPRTQRVKINRATCL